MDFSILGPLEVRDGGRVLPLGGAKQRALLAMLLLHANELVPSDRLIDELWGEARPEAAAKALSVAVARLRKVLAPEGSPAAAQGVLRTRSPGYELRVARGRLDLHRFEDLATAGRRASDPASAARDLHAALSLWRGPPLADLSYASFLQPEIARLEELRMAALEERVDADLALGRHAELVGELEAGVGEHPLRERLRAQLILALYRSGRQAEALGAYRTARATLVEELGIEPGHRLRALHQAILEQDPALDLAARAPPAAEPPGRMFVGRGRQLAELVVGFGDAVAGNGRLFLLAGEPGIGKSRLAEALSAHAQARGAHVLVGRSWEAGGAPAYWPWVQALRPYVRACDPALLVAQLGAGAAEIAPVLPELGERLSDLPPPSTLEPELARFRLFDATAEFLRNAAEDRPIVLVLDDLHAADPPSLLLLRFLARALTASRVLLIGAYRDVDPLPGPALADMLAEVLREPGTRRLFLDGLSRPEVGEYVQLAATDIATPELVSTVHGQTEGNPLFVAEIVRLLAIEGARPGAPRLGVPQGVRDVIARRLTHLPPASRRLLVLAAVLGREFRVDVLARVGGVSDDEALDWLEEAVAAGVVCEPPGSPGLLRFEHVLFRDTLYDGLAALRRVRLHAVAVEALERLEHERPGTHLPELARHAIAAGDGDKGLRYARHAAERALERHTYEEAARLYGLALEALELRPRGARVARCELLLAAGDALVSAGSIEAAHERFLAATDIARSGRRPEALALAALGYAGRTVWQRAGDDDRLVPLLEEALTAVGDGAPMLRARLLARMAGALRDQPTLEPRASLSRDAVRIARGLDDPETLSTALVAHFLSIWGPDVEELVPIAEEVTRLAADTGASALVPDALMLESIVAWLTLEAGAATLDDRFDAIAEELGQSALCWQAAMQNTVWALFRGDFAAAENLAEEALARGSARRSDADCSYRLAMFVLRREQGRLGEIEDLIRAAPAAYPGYRSFRCFVPLLDVELGFEDAARRAFAELAAGDFGSLPRDSEWLFCLAILAEVAARLGDRAAADVLYRLLAPYGSVNVMVAGEIAVGPVARFLGVLAAATARTDEAVRHFEEAIAVIARMDGRPWLAHAQDDYARLLAARGRPGDAARVRELLTACAGTYRELDMVGYAAEAGRLLAAA